MSPPHTINVSIIIVCWNSGAFLPRCLQSLVAQTYRDFEVIVVDNASTDGATVELPSRYPTLALRLERLEQNSGFAAANNVGARLARGAWLALLNPDAFPEPDWLEQLIKVADAHPNCFVASRQLQAGRRDLLDGEGDVYHISGLAWRDHYGAALSPAGGVREVFSACAAAALFPLAEFLAVGGFDESFFAYHEDVDLGFRLRARGLTCLFAPSAVVYHVGYGSSGRRSVLSTYYGHRNLVWTYVKDMPNPWLWIYLPLHLALNVFSLLFFTIAGEGRVIWRAKFDALRGLPRALRNRRAIQPQRRVAVSEIRRTMTREWLAAWEQFRIGRSRQLD